MATGIGTVRGVLERADLSMGDLQSWEEIDWSMHSMHDDEPRWPVERSTRRASPTPEQTASLAAFADVLNELTRRLGALEARKEADLKALLESVTGPLGEEAQAAEPRAPLEKADYSALMDFDD